MLTAKAYTHGQVPISLIGMWPRVKNGRFQARNAQQNVRSVVFSKKRALILVELYRST
jgi:hypothetical protein